MQRAMQRGRWAVTILMTPKTCNKLAKRHKLAAPRTDQEACLNKAVLHRNTKAIFQCDCPVISEIALFFSEIALFSEGLIASLTTTIPLHDMPPMGEGHDTMSQSDQAAKASPSLQKSAMGATPVLVRAISNPHQPCQCSAMVNEEWDAVDHIQALEQTFPRCVPEPVLIDHMTKVLEKHGFTASTSINLVSTCRDEICRPFTEYLDDKWGTPSFNISSLAGMVFCGRTGILRVCSLHLPYV